MTFAKSEQLASKRVKKKPKSERQKLEKKLDDLVSKICRDKGQCTTCGKRNCVLNAHHFKSRKYHGVRWYLPNLICLCVHCHVFNFNFSAHKTPEQFKQRMIEIMGQEWVDDIEKRAREHTSWKIDDLRQMYSKLLEENKRLTSIEK